MSRLTPDLELHFENLVFSMAGAVGFGLCSWIQFENGHPRWGLFLALHTAIFMAWAVADALRYVLSPSSAAGPTEPQRPAIFGRSTDDGEG